MTKFLLLLVLSIVSFAEEEMHLSADYIEYIKDEIALKGNIRITHPIGKIVAEKAIMYSDHIDGLFLNRINLEKYIQIIFNNTATLSCDSACIDSYKQLAIFKGNKDTSQPVVFSDSIAVSKKEKKPLSIQGEEIEVLGSLEDHNQGNDEIFSLEKLLVRDQVKIHYSHEFVMFADQGTYYPTNTLHSGKLLLTSQPKKQCHLIHIKGNEIKGKGIEIDTKLGIISIQEPKLQCKMSDSSYISLLSQYLLWNYPENIISLSKDIFFKHPLYGEVSVDKEVILHANKKKSFEQIECIGNVVVQQHDEKKKSKLSLLGSLLIDDQKKELYCVCSPLSTEQIHYVDSFGEIYSNQAKMLYKDIEGVLQLSKIELLGDVRLHNYSSFKPQEKQYALSDRVEYYPQREVAILSSNQSQAVLYYDPYHQVYVSAPSIEVRRDEKKGSPFIKAIGHVRAYLNTVELDEIKNKFL